ncbi:MAG: phosphatidylserine/phosphatidylglycerophosphate/cardiolipin synthase family protein [Patescibacteria group bacterium]|jgi:cardiolipin synthase|nr:phosphatidylserine/phosphatidylglycerophosphate/cardiolipin synthase family protein [Patescibacteria group bacterium]
MDNFKFIYKNRELYKEMLHDIRGAHKYVYLETYIFDDDKIGKKFREELERKALEGLDIKILLDDYGTALNKKYFKTLINNGADVRFFRKLKFSLRFIHRNNHRNHRKILVIDDKISYLGSSNISHRTINWWELNIRMKGRISPLFKKIFLLNFKIYNKLIFRKKIHTKIIKFEDIEIIRDVPSIRIRNFRRKKIELIQNARKSLIIETPYFIPEPLFIRKLRKAIKRGVNVTLLVPKKSDVKIVDIISKKYLGIIYKIGVNIKLYKPNVLHSKAILVDDESFLFGSTNIDPRSSILQFEINLAGKNKEMAHQLRDHFNHTIYYAENFNFNEWSKRPKIHKFFEYISNKIIKLL